MMNKQPLDLDDFPDVGIGEALTPKELSTPAEAVKAAIRRGRRIPLLEGVIATQATSAFDYVMLVLKQPFPSGERAIATSPRKSAEYGIRILKKRFLLGEAAIATSERFSKMYLKHFPDWVRPDVPFKTRIEDDFPSQEGSAQDAAPVFSTSPKHLVRLCVLSGRRDPVVESIVCKQPTSAWNYARNVIKGPWDGPYALVAEASINTNAGYAKGYLLLCTQARILKESLPPPVNATEELEAIEQQLSQSCEDTTAAVFEEMAADVQAISDGLVREEDVEALTPEPSTPPTPMVVDDTGSAVPYQPIRSRVSIDLEPGAYHLQVRRNSVTGGMTCIIEEVEA